MNEELEKIDSIKRESPDENPLQKKFVVRPLRTYEEDVASFVKRGQISTAKIIEAERKRQLVQQKHQKEEVIEKKSNKALFISIILIILGGIALGLVYYFGDEFAPKPQGPIIKTADRDVLIDKKTQIFISSDDKLNTEIKNEVLQVIKNPPVIGDNEIAEIVITKKIVTTNNKGEQVSSTEKVSINEILAFLELRMPDLAVRSLEGHYTFGVIGIKGNRAPFFLIRTQEFQRVFAGMLEWERSILREVNDIFFEKLGTNDSITLTIGNRTREQIESGSGVNTATDPLREPKNITDVLIANRDARAITSAGGEILFFYTFVTNNHLLLASETEIVQNMAQKINLQNIVR